jgi:hypothetical protein
MSNIGEAHRKLNRPRAQRVVLQEEIMKPSVHYRYSAPHSVHILYLHVLYGSYNKQRLLPHTVFTIWSF